ncbi:cytochrome aa3 quinol oxidase subunit III [Marinithermofilum abyssi]|uniref:Quinol oxidase subunit 3 n=1 Tax=Marinithermofilum abyssi TaxID=1571185 RepID=A0A8J2Y935_9BACL|nr:cytochrome aa3 quinol oxidase subunit III [Marinithermofilum abyssi]GGE14130.1 cytochrome aa3 quinol oxidase subunit III [Marinithermofilum abyssi]
MATQNNHASTPLEYSTEEGRLKIFGFWVFLGAEIVLFATLFATYLTYQHATAGGPTPQDLFVVKDFMIETLLLLASSFTCGLAIYEMRRGNQKALLLWYIVTLLLGAGFLYFEIHEFFMYVTEEGATMQTSAFLSSFFVLLGTHGAHVTLGIFWIILLLIQLQKRGITPVTSRKLFVAGLYWHFLDVVWIFIYTLVYLMGVAG